MRLIISTLLILAFFLSCSEDEEQPEDQLESLSILGTWEIISRTYDGISDLIPLHGEFIELLPDDDPRDLKGEFRYYDARSENSGLFILLDQNQVIRFEYNETTRDCQLLIPDVDVLIFRYERDGVIIEEDWLRSP